MFKDRIKKQIAKKEDQRSKLYEALINAETVDERRNINESIRNIEAELKELGDILNECDERADDQSANGELRRVGTSGSSDDVFESLEYRRAFMRGVTTGQRIDFRADETTLTTSTNVGTVIPTNLMNRIIEKWEQLGVIYNLVTKTAYAVGQTIPTDGVKPVATWVAEGASSDAQKKTLGGTITFSHFKLRCEIRYTEEVSVMTLPMFETLFVKQVSDAMLRAIEGAIISGNGTSMPKGILTATAPEGQAIEIAADDKLTYKLLCDAEAAIPMEYEQTTKWVMTKKTFNAFLAMTDTVGQPIARVNYGISGRPERTLLGRDVVIYAPQAGSLLGTYADTVAADTIFAFLVDFGDYVLNENYNLGVQTAQDWDNEDHKTKAVLACDGKLIITDSLVTLTKKVA